MGLGMAGDGQVSLSCACPNTHIEVVEPSKYLNVYIAE